MSHTTTLIILITILAMIILFFVWNAREVRREEKELNRKWNELHNRRRIDMPRHIDASLDVTEEFYHN